MKVKNINGTGDHACPCGCWLKHWGKFSRGKAGLCKELACTNYATVGTLVQKFNSKDKSGYIIPLCGIHNKMTGQGIELLGNPSLIPAKVHKFCGK